MPTYFPDPLHKPGSATSHWSTDNVGEALPGVATPLGWAIWESGSDKMCRDLSFSLGIFNRAERSDPAPNEDPLIQIFYGRAAMRIEWLATVGDRMPGTTAEEAISGLLGRVPETLEFHPTRARYPVIAWKLPLAALRTPRAITTMSTAIAPWWRAQTASLPSAEEATARAALFEGAARFRHAMTVHGIGLFALMTPLVQALGKLVETTGVGDVGALSGPGGAEMAIVEDLWRASRGILSIEAVVANHGYHGPHEGELSSRVWREDSAPLRRMIGAYADRDEVESPISRDARARAELPALQAELVAALPAPQRPATRALLRYAARTVPLRGVGKAAFRQAFDVSRAAARRLGELLAGDGRLADPQDVFYLTLAELSGPVPADARERVDERRLTRAEYEAMRIPAAWRGTPIPEPVDVSGGDPFIGGDEARSTITGIPASAGSVDGLVRVVHDPSFAEVQPGEILVTHSTDPSWASIMFVSAALVVDIGGIISHAAVVARELGIPCVVNTRCGTDVLRDGDRVRVDGTTGTVEVLRRAAAPANLGP